MSTMTAPRPINDITADAFALMMSMVPKEINRKPGELSRHAVAAAEMRKLISEAYYAGGHHALELINEGFERDTK